MPEITVHGISYALVVEQLRQGWSVAVHRDRQHLGDVLYAKDLALRHLPPALAHLRAEIGAAVAAERDRLQRR